MGMREFRPGAAGCRGNQLAAAAPLDDRDSGLIDASTVRAHMGFASGAERSRQRHPRMDHGNPSRSCAAALAAVRRFVNRSDRPH
jgi:hypothetical protein